MLQRFVLAPKAVLTTAAALFLAAGLVAWTLFSPQTAATPSFHQAFAPTVQALAQSEGQPASQPVGQLAPVGQPVVQPTGQPSPDLPPGRSLAGQSPPTPVTLAANVAINPGDPGNLVLPPGHDSGDTVATAGPAIAPATTSATAQAIAPAAPTIPTNLAASPPSTQPLQPPPLLPFATPLASTTLPVSAPSSTTPAPSAPKPTHTPAPTATPTLPPFDGTPVLSTGAKYGDHNPNVPGRVVRIAAPSIKLDTKVYEVYGISGVWEVAEYAAGHTYSSKNPGEGGNVVLAGHNNWKGEVFRYLENLQPGNEIDLWTQAGKKYVYHVRTLSKLNEVGVSYGQRVKNGAVMNDTPHEQLTLITCWPYTTFTHRLIVVADPS